MSRALPTVYADEMDNYIFDALAQNLGRYVQDGGNPQEWYNAVVVSGQPENIVNDVFAVFMDTYGAQPALPQIPGVPGPSAFPSNESALMWGGAAVLILLLLVYKLK